MPRSKKSVPINTLESSSVSSVSSVETSRPASPISTQIAVSSSSTITSPTNKERSTTTTPTPEPYDPDMFYQRIKDMVFDLGNEFGRQQHSLKLFKHMMQRMEDEPNPVAKDQIVAKFERFVHVNRKGILGKDVGQLTTHVLVYHNNVNIKFAEIFRLADAQTKDTIWAHLQALLSVIDPDNVEIERALQAYQQQQQSSVPEGEVDENSREALFIKGIIEDIQPDMSSLGSNPGNPMAGIDLMGMMSRVTRMLDSNGSDGLDPEKLLSTVHSMSMKQIKLAKQHGR